MSLAQDLDDFIKQSGDNIFIEAEARPSRLKKFYIEYNKKHTPTVNDNTDGIIVLEENANKWGLELRLYLHKRPPFIQTTRNTVYRKEYPYRINDVNVIKELFDMGYKIGIN